MVLCGIVLCITVLPWIAQHVHDVKSYKFIIMTKSEPQSLKDREFLRHKSWLSYDWKDDKLHALSWRHFFLLGVSMSWPRSEVRKENEKYGDILEAPSIDTNSRMTYKLMWGFRHAIENHKFKFLVLLDEDSVVNVHKLDRYLSRLEAEGRDKLFYGGCNCYQRSHHKSSTSLEEWPTNRFPTYCLGTGLIFSFDAIQELLRCWDNDRQPIIGRDEVQIGLLLLMSGKIAVNRILHVTYGCEANNTDAIIITQIKPNDVGAQMMKNYMENGTYCNENVLAQDARPGPLHYV